MPQKPNFARKMQNYIPQGNGDASGEYADDASGSNVHYKSDGGGFEQGLEKSGIAIKGAAPKGGEKKADAKKGGDDVRRSLDGLGGTYAKCWDAGSEGSRKIISGISSSVRVEKTARPTSSTRSWNRRVPWISISEGLEAASPAGLKTRGERTPLFLYNWAIWKN